MQNPRGRLDYNPKVGKQRFRIVKTSGKTLGWRSKNAQNGKDMVLKLLVDKYETNYVLLNIIILNDAENSVQNPCRSLDYNPKVEKHR